MKQLQHRLTLYDVRSQLSRFLEGAVKPPVEQISAELQENVVPRQLFLQLERVLRVILDAKREHDRVHLLHLLQHVLRRVQPVPLLRVVDEPQAEVVLLEEVELAANLVHQLLALVMPLKVALEDLFLLVEEPHHAAVLLVDLGLGTERGHHLREGCGGVVETCAVS